jgi:hypothetical protein
MMGCDHFVTVPALVSTSRPRIMKNYPLSDEIAGSGSMPLASHRGF